MFRTFQSAPVTLRIRSRSPKSNKLFSFSQQCIYASLVKIHLLVQKIMHRNESGSRQFWTFQSAPVTLKIKSSPPKSNQSFPLSQQCIYASLVKIHELVQKIMHRCTQNKADAEGSQPKTINPLTFWVVSLFVCVVALRPKSTAMVMLGRSVHLTTLFPGQAGTSS